MNNKKIILVLVLFVLVASSVVVFLSMKKQSEVDTNKPAVTTGNTNITNDNGKNPQGTNKVNDKGINNTDGKKDMATGDAQSIIEQGGMALVDSGLVSSEDNLYSEKIMYDNAQYFIEGVFLPLYGTNEELVGDEKAIRSFLDNYFKTSASDLDTLAEVFAAGLNFESFTPDLKYTLHGVKQLNDNSFAMYFYLHGKYLDNEGKVLTTIESPYHIVTLTDTNGKGNFVITYYSISDESYIKQ